MANRVPRAARALGYAGQLQLSRALFEPARAAREPLAVVVVPAYRAAVPIEVDANRPASAAGGSCEPPAAATPLLPSPPASSPERYRRRPPGEREDVSLPVSLDVSQTFAGPPSSRPSAY